MEIVTLSFQSSLSFRNNQPKSFSNLKKPDDLIVLETQFTADDVLGDRNQLET